MNILQISYNDLIGRRFNGVDLNRYFRVLGHDAQQLVWCKDGDDKFTWRMSQKLYRVFEYKVRDYINRLIAVIEMIFSVQSVLYPWPIQLFYDKHFLDCDIVHYHLLHNGYFSFYALPKLTSLKPSVLTIHDPWLMTGHCVYPYDCERWKSGCGQCQDLTTFLPMRYDNTRYMFNTKKRIMANTSIDIVVASQFMLDMVQNSSIFKNNRIHLIPFGVNFDIFRKLDSDKLRIKYGIGLNNLVISFRGTVSEYKGLPYIKEALRRLSFHKYNVPITLLTVDQKGLLSEFMDKYHVVELGMVTDESVMAEFFNCSDIFLMPSTAEAFGMMAIEAMSCGKPVITFDGTSIPQVIFSPIGGVSVPMKDSIALCAAIDRLLNNPDERKTIGYEAYRISRIHYNFEDHARRTLSLYQEVIARRVSE